MAGSAPYVTERPAAADATAAAMDAELDAAIKGSPRFPDGTAFVPADMVGLGRALDEHLSAGHTVVLVFADGHQRVVSPPSRPAAAVSFSVVSVALAGVVARLTERARELAKRQPPEQP